MLKIPQKTEYVINTLLSKGYEAYIVGGCVRDMLLSKIPNDFDVTTSAEPNEVIALFEKTIPTGIKHGTVTVMVQGEPVEVTTFRTEGGYTDCRRPDEVHFVKSLREDLARRDFTVNAMAFNKTIGLMDYFGGKVDLENRILRAVGEADKRFKEDALRILRLFRFASVLGFSIEAQTLSAAVENAHLLSHISRERILNEISLSVMGENLQAIRPLLENGSLEFLRLTKIPDFSVLKKLPSNKNLRLFAFLRLSAENPSAVLDELKASNQRKNYCSALSLLDTLPFPKTKADIKNMLALTTAQNLRDWFSFKSAFGTDCAKSEKMLQEVEEGREPYLISHLKIGGEYIRSLGFSGKEVGSILEKMRLLVIDNPKLNTEETLKKEILKIKP